MCLGSLGAMSILETDLFLLIAPKDIVEGGARTSAEAILITSTPIIKTTTGLSMTG